MRGWVSARKVLAVLAAALQAGLSAREALAAVDLCPEDVRDPEGWVSQDAWAGLWEHVVHETGDPLIGLRAASDLDPGYFGVIDYAARSCANVGEAVPLAARYFRLANTWGRLELTRLDDGLRVSRHVVGDEAMRLPRQAAEFALATMLRVFRLAARPFPLSEVRFRYPRPPDEAPYLAHFGCPVRFGCPEDAIDLPAAALAVPMRAPDPRLRAIVESHAANLLADLEGPEATTTDLVRHHLARRLSHGAPTLDELARALGQSGRTLQRRLAEEGQTWRGVLDALRAELARAWLAGGMSQGEVAFLLGFSEVSALCRAFQGWTGQSPGAWARSAGAGRQASVADGQ